MLAEIYNSQLAVGWGTAALLAAGVAQGKNRSGLGWFLGAFFFGPLAIFILVAFCEKLPPVFEP